MSRGRQHFGSFWPCKKGFHSLCDEISPKALQVWVPSVTYHWFLLNPVFNWSEIHWKELSKMRMMVASDSMGQLPLSFVAFVAQNQFFRACCLQLQYGASVQRKVAQRTRSEIENFGCNTTQIYCLRIAEQRSWFWAKLVLCSFVQLKIVAWIQQSIFPKRNFNHKTQVLLFDVTFWPLLLNVHPMLSLTQIRSFFQWPKICKLNKSSIQLIPFYTLGKWIFFWSRNNGSTLSAFSDCFQSRDTNVFSSSCGGNGWVVSAWGLLLTPMFLHSQKMPTDTLKKLHDHWANSGNLKCNLQTVPSWRTTKWVKHGLSELVNFHDIERHPVQEKGNYASFNKEMIDSFSWCITQIGSVL